MLFEDKMKKLLREFNFFDKLILYTVIFMTIIIFIGDNKFNYPIIVSITFFINGTIIIGGINNSIKRKKNLLTAFWVFNFMFNFIAPLEQLERGIFPFYNKVNYDDVVYANILLLLSYIIIGVTSLKVKKSVKNNKTEKNRTPYESKNIQLKFLLAFVCLSTAICIYYIVSFGIKSLLFRSTATSLYESGTQFLIQGTVFPAILSATAIFSILRYKNKHSFVNGFLVVYSILILFLTFSPFSMARFKVATIYGALFLVMFPALKKGERLATLLILGLIYVFPLMSVFRNANFNNIGILIKSSLTSIKENVLTGDYDTYSSITVCIAFVREHGLSFGKQFLGVLLFFVPRSIWPQKPIGSGAFMASENSSSSFTNVSCQLIAEGYINFGFLGSILIMFIFSFFLRGIEENSVNKSCSDNFLKIVINNYLVFLLFFILRGDLLSSFSFSFGLIFITYIMGYIVSRCTKKIC